MREDAAEKDAAVAAKSTTAENFANMTDFDWTGFLTRVQDLNDAIYVQLKKVSYELMGNALHLYPRQKVVKNILSHKNNLQVLTDAAVNLKIVIHEAGEKPAHQAQNTQKDAMLAKISAIMGGEVEKDGGENPF